ncbi:glycosyl hydrolase [Paractinoplanes atraurantiacus]|uniref:Chitinase n=1 Tax=Paractinoplanes atraurantiacus TaxID=1036182 RepID=A0A285H2P1_9ACTN|nr:glycosyl hydrolase [Actinoplanes atraurantiacus]SNY30099.1 chitinase [Actinoplanes atraurantiacus]
MLARIAVVALVFAAAACSSSSSTSSEPSASASSAGAPPAVAPYVDIVSGTADISAIASATGQKDYTLAFILADSSGGCTATWGGKTALDDSTIAAEIAKFTALGGTPIVATGGASGTYLETACTSADDLAAQYEAALDQAGSNFLDVDIEQTVTPATVVSALSKLQAARGTSITLTVPVGGTVLGLTDASIALLTAAEAAGLDVTINAMTMNFDGGTADWGTAMTTATEAVKADVAAVWSGKSDTEIYGMLGVTPMIGVNDSYATTTVANATTLRDWAEDKGLAFVRFWSVNRDNNGCTDGTVSATCSGIAQTEYAFTSLFAEFTT